MGALTRSHAMAALDTIKVNLQAGWRGTAAAGAKAAGPVAVAGRLFREGGAKRFYKGVGGAVGGTAPAVAARMAVRPTPIPFAWP